MRHFKEFHSFESGQQNEAVTVCEHDTFMNVVTESEDQRGVRRKPAGGNRHHTPDLRIVGGQKA